CNAAWVISQLRSTPNNALNDFQKFTGSFSTPFKSAGFSGWVTTGCSAAGTGTLVRDAARSTDGFTTIDVRLDSLAIAGSAAPNGKFLRLEVRPNIALPQQPLLAGRRVGFSGPVLIDMDLEKG